MKSKSKINHRKSRKRSTRFVFWALGVSLLLAFVIVGGKSQLAAREPDALVLQGMNPQQVAGTIKANAQALKAFNYQQRMQLQLKGETKKVTVNLITQDSFGNQQKTLLNEQPSEDSQDSSGGGRGGRLKQKIVAKKTGEFKQMMDDIATLVKSYTELPHEQMQAALQKATFSQAQGDMAGSVQIQMQNVIQQGDSMTIWIDRQAMLFRRVAIATSYENNPVTVTANYAMLPSGQVYMAQAILNYPKKEVVVQIDNSNYQRS